MIWVVLVIIIIGASAALSSGSMRRQASPPRPVRHPVSGTGTMKKRPSASVGVTRRATRNGGGAGRVIKPGSYPSSDSVTTASNGASTQEKASCIDARPLDSTSSGSREWKVAPQRSDWHSKASTVAIPAELIASVDDAGRTAL